MIKAIPLSIVIASIVLPIALAARPNPRRTLRRLQWSMAALALVWVLLCLHLYPRFVHVQ